MHTLAALASIPRRAQLLEKTLQTLRPQVDRLHVYLNGYDTAPACVRSLCDDYILDADNRGAERKFWWSPQWRGIYLSCDDDISYPPDYVATMRRALDERGRGVVTCHGRRYLDRARNVHQIDPRAFGRYFKRVDNGAAINHGGTGVMAWRASEVRVPRHWEHANIADMQFAIWAQRERVPMWLVPHEAHWLQSPAVEDPDGIWRKSCAEDHARRNALLNAHSENHGWKLWD